MAALSDAARNPSSPAPWNLGTLWDRRAAISDTPATDREIPDQTRNRSTAREARRREDQTCEPTFGRGWQPLLSVSQRRPPPRPPRRSFTSVWWHRSPARSLARPRIRSTVLTPG